jgi:BirA family transcriptional regulator, biotin operon repressor / biotin---[acetyl-CoA-carboxylase] ligase
MIGSPRVHWRLADSTNERAKELARAGAPHGTLVTAAEQTAGRGRQGRTWTAPPGKALLMSMLVRGLDERHALLPPVAALAVCDACEREASTPPCQIKWPNDVWIEGRKVAGILIEGRPQAGWAVIGIGLNLDIQEHELPDGLRATATSLAMVSEAPPVERVLTAVLRGLDGWLAAAPEEVLRAWRERDALLGRRVRWQGGEGTAAGIDDGGALLVDTGSGRAHLDAGEVHLSV